MKKLYYILFLLAQFFVLPNVYAGEPPDKPQFTDDEKASESRFIENDFGYEEAALPTLSPDDVSSTQAVCPTYKKFRLTIVTSSVSGQLSNTGWQEVESWATCDPVKTGQTAPVCNSVIIPGVSLGDGDRTITTCITEKIECVKDCKKCEASKVVSSKKKELFKIKFLTDKLTAMAEKAPMIKKMEFSLKGEYTEKYGEECCSKDPADPPVKYTDYGGTIGIGLKVELNIPGWAWKGEYEWEGIYKIKYELSLGPTIEIGPSASASIAGRVYDKKKCPSCVTVTLEAKIALTVKLGGKALCDVSVFEGSWWEYKGKFEMFAEASLGTSIGISGKWDWEDCPKPGVTGKLSYGELKGTAKAGVTIFGNEISIERSVILLDGASVSFP